MGTARMSTLSVVLWLAACQPGQPGDEANRAEADVGAQVAQSPRSLVLEYLERDAAGEFRGLSGWLDSNVTFEPVGFDQAAVVTSYDVLGSQGKGDTTAVTVRYHWIAVIGGDGSGGTRLVPRDSTEVTEFHVIRRDDRLLIAGPERAPHVSVSAVLGNPGLTEQQREALRRSIKEPSDNSNES